MNEGEGALEGGVHRFPLRVYYEDTDAAGIVYYANYLKFAERARTELLRLLGFDHAHMKRDFGSAFAVRRCRIDYQAPARLDDLLVVETRLRALRGARMDLQQDVLRDDRLLVALEVELVMFGAELRPVRVPKALRTALDRLSHSPPD